MSVYEHEVVVVEQEQEKRVSVTAPATQSPIPDFEALMKKVSEAKGVAFSMSDFETLVKKMQARGVEPVRNNRGEVLINETLERYRSVLGGAISVTLGLINRLSRHAQGALARDREELLSLMQAVSAADTPTELLRLFDRVYELHDKYTKMPLKIDELVSDYHTALERVAAEATSTEEKKVAEELKAAVTLLRDKKRLKDMLARFFMLMDAVRSETYNSYMQAYGEHIQALLRVLQGWASYDDFVKAMTAAKLLQDLEAKGALKYEEYYRVTGEPFYKIALYDDPRKVYEKKLAAIERGQVPERTPLPSVQLAESLAAINPSRYLYDAIHGALSKFMPESAARSVATAATSSVLSAIGTLIPPVGIAAAVMAVADAIADIGSRLQNPVDREAFDKFVREHWQEILVNTAIGIAAGGLTAYGVAKVKPQVYMAVARAVEKVNPGLADKIYQEVTKLTVSQYLPSRHPEYVVGITSDDKLVVVERSTGRLVKVSNLKVPEGLRGLLADDEFNTYATVVLGKLGKENVDTLLQFLDDCAKTYGLEATKRFVSELGRLAEQGRLRALNIESAYGVKGAIAAVDDGLYVVTPAGERVSILASSELISTVKLKPESYSLFYLLRSANVDVDDAIRALSPYLQQYALNKSVYGSARVGNYVFDFTGNTVVVRLGESLVATIPLDGLDLNAVRNLASIDRALVASYGEALTRVIHDTLLVGYGLRAPQVVAPALVTPEATVSFDVSNLLPPATLAKGRYLVTERGSVYVSRQLLESGVDVKTAVTTAEVRGLLSKVYGREAVSVIELPPEAAKYVRAAISTTGGKDPFTLLKTATEIASSAGDAKAASLLQQLKLVYALERVNVANLPVVSVLGDGTVVVGAVSSPAVAAAISTVSAQIARGDVEQAQRTLESVLVASGVRPDVAEQLAMAVVREVATPAVQAPREVEVLVQVPVTVKRRVVVPLRDYEAVEQLGEERATGLVVELPVQVPVVERKTAVVALANYEAVEQLAEDATRGLVVTLPYEALVEVRKRVPVHSATYSALEQLAEEEARGLVVPVQVVVQEPIVEVLEVETEEGVVVPAPPTPPQPSPTTTPAVLPPLGSALLPGALGAPAPQPRGRRELEEVVY